MQAPFECRVSCKHHLNAVFHASTIWMPCFMQAPFECRVSCKHHLNAVFHASTIWMPCFMQAPFECRVSCKHHLNVVFHASTILQHQSSNQLLKLTQSWFQKMIQLCQIQRFNCSFTTLIQCWLCKASFVSTKPRGFFSEKFSFCQFLSKTTKYVPKKWTIFFDNSSNLFFLIFRSWGPLYFSICFYRFLL